MIGNLILSLHRKEGYFHHGTSIKILLLFSKPQFSNILPGSASILISQIVNIFDACTPRYSVKVNSFIKGSIFSICLCHYSDLMCLCLTIEHTSWASQISLFFLDVKMAELNILLGQRCKTFSSRGTANFTQPKFQITMRIGLKFPNYSHNLVNFFLSQ